MVGGIWCSALYFTHIGSYYLVPLLMMFAAQVGGWPSVCIEEHVMRCPVVQF